MCVCVCVCVCDGCKVAFFFVWINPPSSEMRNMHEQMLLVMVDSSELGGQCHHILGVHTHAFLSCIVLVMMFKHRRRANTAMPVNTAMSANLLCQCS